MAGVFIRHIASPSFGGTERPYYLIALLMLICKFQTGRLRFDFWEEMKRQLGVVLNVGWLSWALA